MTLEGFGMTGVMPGPRLELARARETHREIAQRFLLPRFVYIRGNHDLVAASADCADEHVVHADGQRISVTH